MIAPVSFRSTAAASQSSFADRIRQPQTFSVKADPNASSPISGKKGGVGKFIKGVLVTAAVVATALGLSSKFGLTQKLVNMTKEGSILRKGAGLLDKVGNTVKEYAGKAIGLGKSLWAKISGSANNLAEEAAEVVA